MNQVAQQQKLGAQVALTSSEGGFAVTPQTLNDIVEFAKFMSLSNAGIPAFLRGNAPDCAAVTMQSLKWGFDPFSVAQKSYKVKDIIAYEAQLIAAVINARSGIKGRLKYQFDGSGEDLTCTVTGTLDGEECTYTSPRVGNITTKNSPLWKTDPQQQLGYYSSRNWARRHCPEVILGAYDRDEAEEFRGPDRAKDITPSEPSVMHRLRAAQSATQEAHGAREGFDPDHVTRETSDALTGEIIDNPDTGAEASPISTGPVEADDPQRQPEDDGQTASVPSSSSLFHDDEPQPIPAEELLKLRAYAKDVLNRAADPNTSADAMKKIESRWAEDIRKLSPRGRQAAGSIAMSVRAVMRNETSVESAIGFHAEGLGCEPEELGGVNG
jgi:hypothetical protein